MRFAGLAARTLKHPGCFASLHSVQESAPLAPLCGYPKEKKEILSSKDTMANFIARRSELDKMMDDKLAKIMALLEDKDA